MRNYGDKAIVGIIFIQPGDDEREIKIATHTDLCHMVADKLTESVHYSTRN